MARERKFNGEVFEWYGWCSSVARKESIKDDIKRTGHKARTTTRGRTLDGTGYIYDIWSSQEPIKERR